MGHRHPNRPAPDTALVGDEAGHKIFILSGWNSVIEPDAGDLVTRAGVPIPLTMKGH